MEIKLIRNEADYDAALEAIDGLMSAALDTPEGNKLEVLVTLVEAYEAEHWPLEAPDPVSVIEHVMEARGLRQRDLATLIGSQPRASEVLNRRRPLTLPMIRALSREWKLPADMLVREYRRYISRFGGVMMAKIEMSRLRLLHQVMKARHNNRCQFPFHRNCKKFDVLFFADKIPYELMFGLVGDRFSFKVRVSEDYRIDPRLDRDDYRRLCKALDLEYNPDNPFRPAYFFEDLNNNIPNEISQDNEVKPQDVARHYPSIEEADKIYFVRWLQHLNPKIQWDVTEHNLEKTRRLLGEDIYLHCKERRISTVWTDDPQRANDSWRCPP